MFYSSIQSVRKEIAYLKRIRKNAQRLLLRSVSLEQFFLSVYQTKTARYYKIGFTKDGKTTRKYIGRKLTREAERICERKMLQRILENAENNIKYLEALEQHYQPVNPNDLREQLPLAYRAVPPSVFEVTETFDAQAMAQARYSDKSALHHPERLIHTTSDGHRVRSKNELLAVYILEKLGIPFEYEHELMICGEKLWVDLWLRHPDGSREAPLEIFGMMDDPDYRNKAANRVGLYIKGGYTPGADAFFVYCNSFGPFNGRTLEQQLQRWLTGEAAA